MKSAARHRNPPARLSERARADQTFDALIGAAILNVQAGHPSVHLPALERVLRDTGVRGHLTGWLMGQSPATLRDRLNPDGHLDPQAAQQARSELTALHQLLSAAQGRPSRGGTPASSPLGRVLQATHWLLCSGPGRAPQTPPPVNLSEDELVWVGQLHAACLSPGQVNPEALTALPQTWKGPPNPARPERHADVVRLRQHALWAAEYAARHPQGPQPGSRAWDWPSWLMGRPQEALISTQPDEPAPPGWNTQDHTDAETVAAILQCWWSARPPSPGEHLPFWQGPAPLEPSGAQTHGSILQGEAWALDTCGPWRGQGADAEWRLMSRVPTCSPGAATWFGPLGADADAISLQLLSTRQARAWLRAGQARGPRQGDPALRLNRPARGPGQLAWDAEVIRRTLQFPMPRLPQLALAALALRHVQGQNNPLAHAARLSARAVQTGAGTLEVRP